MVVVDDLDERLDLAALRLAGLRHSAGDLGGVALDAGDQGVRVRVRLVASILGLDDDNLEHSQSAFVCAGPAPTGVGSIPNSRFLTFLPA